MQEATDKFCLLCLHSFEEIMTHYEKVHNVIPKRIDVCSHCDFSTAYRKEMFMHLRKKHKLSDAFLKNFEILQVPRSRFIYSFSNQQIQDFSCRLYTLLEEETPRVHNSLSRYLSLLETTPPPLPQSVVLYLTSSSGGL